MFLHFQGCFIERCASCVIDADVFQADDWGHRTHPACGSNRSAIEWWDCLVATRLACTPIHSPVHVDFPLLHASKTQAKRGTCCSVCGPPSLRTEWVLLLLPGVDLFLSPFVQERRNSTRGSVCPFPFRTGFVSFRPGFVSQVAILSPLSRVSVRKGDEG